MIEIVSAFNCSFGNGTRHKGFVFAEVEFKGGNKLFQLRSELRDPANRKSKDFETAKIKLSEGVTRRELRMVLNNARAFEAVPPKQDLRDLNASQSIEAIGSMDADQLEKFKAGELAGKKRKSVLEAIDSALEAFGTNWRSIEISSLKVDKSTVEILTAAKLTTIGAIQVHIDENDGLELEGLTEDLVNELLTSIKENIK